MLRELTRFQPQEYLTLYDNMEFVIRMIIATCLGGLIGLERSIRSKEAGIRTHCIVSLSAALFMLLSKYAFMDVTMLDLNKTDNARIAAQVVSGISFLGAGIIFKQGRSGGVKGLTTAAGIWATAAVGLSIGSGLYIIGFSATLIILFLQFILHRHPAGNAPPYDTDLLVRMKDLPELHKALEELLLEKKSTIDSTRIKRENGQVEIIMSIRSHYPFKHGDVVSFLEQHPDVYELGI